jgi:hypothetical protein
MAGRLHPDAARRDADRVPALADLNDPFPPLRAAFFFCQTY